MIPTMFSPRSASPLVLALLAGVGLAAAPAAADCLTLDPKVRAAVQARDIARFDALAEALRREPTCDAAYRDRVGRTMAIAALAAGRRADGGFEPASVETAARFGRPWQVAIAQGDMAYDRQDWAKAAEAYESALNEIRDAKLVPTPPPRDLEERLMKLAYQAKALAPVYVASRGTRGEPAGVLVGRYRNFTAVSVPVPVRFEFDQAKLTPDGEKAVEDILAMLTAEGAKGVTLIGHTDARGSDGYNLGLSRARAESVAAALAQRGFKGKIAVEGQGESRPFEADDRSKYDSETLFAFDRRVEYRLAP